jgi:predicted Zn-dependent protease
MDAAILAEMPTPPIESLEKLRGTPRDGALLRYSLGLEHLKAGNRERAIAELREALSRDPLYSAAWKTLGRALAEVGRADEAHAAWKSGIEAARAKGDRQAEKEMTVFARRLEKQRGA